MNDVLMINYCISRVDNSWRLQFW